MRTSKKSRTGVSTASLLAAAAAVALTMVVIVRAWPGQAPATAPPAAQTPAPPAHRNLNQIDYAMYFFHEPGEGRGRLRDDRRRGRRDPDRRRDHQPGDHLPGHVRVEALHAGGARAVLGRVGRGAAELAGPAVPDVRGRSGPGAVHCCRPGASTNDATHCPSFPGAAAVAAAEQVNQALRTLHEAISSHLFGPHDKAAERRALQTLLQPISPAAAGAAGAAAGVRGLPAAHDPASMGRVFRQTNGELTVRNQPFHDYVFANNLYNANGVIGGATANAENIYRNAPYRRADGPAGAPGPAALSTIDFPPTAIMIKSNWVNRDLLAAIGVKYGWSWDDGQHGYVQKEMAQTIKDDQGTDRTATAPTTCWPSTSRRRTSRSGCGRRSSTSRCPGGATTRAATIHSGNFLPRSRLARRLGLQLHPPEDDGGRDAGGGRQPGLPARQGLRGETIRPQLAAMLRTLGIGTGGPVGRDPEPTDAAWLSYRLKGTQTNFTDLTGRPTYLGHSVTEAGFVNGSSCISCHARAGTDALGPSTDTTAAGHSTFPLSVFLNDLSDFGYGRSPHGLPDPDWFNQSNQPPNLEVLQTDFVWGFLFARPTVQ